jgi:hypothetical protein
MSINPNVEAKNANVNVEANTNNNFDENKMERETKPVFLCSSTGKLFKSGDQGKGKMYGMTLEAPRFVYDVVSRKRIGVFNRFLRCVLLFDDEENPKRRKFKIDR